MSVDHSGLEHEHVEPVCADCWAWDPLASQRRDTDPPLDVLLTGTVFFDLIFTGLPKLPEPGEEIWSSGLGSGPGGIANLAVAASRLGLRTGLVAGFGDDAYADWMWETLSGQERIDLSASPRFENFHSAVTVSIAHDGDRAMVTHGHPLPAPLGPQVVRAPAARSALADLAGDTSWLPELARRGTAIFADTGFDPSGHWDPQHLAPLTDCFAFTPNALEAMQYTHTDTVEAAVRALAERVPLAIVTDGSRGAHAIDSTTGEQAYCPALPVNALDSTGAGDVFAAATILGTLAGWPLVNRLRFASLCSALAVQHFGGSLAAPGWGDISDWWRTVSAAAAAGEARAGWIAEQYGFLAELLPKHPVQGVRRAEGTFALSSDAEHGHR